MISVLVVVAACGSQSGNDDSAGSSGSQSPTSTAAADSSAVVSVSLSRSGGLKPVAVARTFQRESAPPQGFTSSDVHSALSAAAALTDDSAAVHPVPRNTCCDRYTYTVTITYGDGSTKTFTTVDGLRQPTSFEALIKAMS